MFSQYGHKYEIEQAVARVRPREYRNIIVIEEDHRLCYRDIVEFAKALGVTAEDLE